MRIKYIAKIYKFLCFRNKVHLNLSIKYMMDNKTQPIDKINSSA